MNHLDNWLKQMTDSVQPQLPFARGASRDEWAVWRSKLREKLSESLGNFDEMRVPLEAELVETKQVQDVVRERVLLTTAPGLQMPVYVLRPANKQGRLPVIVALHGHGYGSKEVVGLNPDGSELGGDPGIHRSFALELARRGYLVVAPELFGFGERRLEEDADKPPKENSCYRMAAAFMMAGRTLAGFRVYETLRAVEYAERRDDADAARIGCMGLSGGGMICALASITDERIKASVISGYTNTFADSILARRHCLDNYIPGILRWAEMPDLIGLIAPRPLMLEVGEHDRLFPLHGVRKAVSVLQSVYGSCEASDRFATNIFDGGHEIDGGPAYAWFDRWLQRDGLA